MLILVIFAYASGLMTALTPCVLPVLPIILSSTSFGGRRQPLGIIIGVIGSFTFFTIFLTSLVKALNLPPDILRNIAIFVLFAFGLILLVPRLNQQFERLTSKLVNRVGKRLPKQQGFLGGIILGCVLGILWTPCAGPILASVITLAATSTISTEIVLITFAYACGSATMFLLIAYGGKSITNKIKSLGVHTATIQSSFGWILLIMSAVIFFNLDRRFQTFIVQNLPSWALTPLATIESSEQVSSLINQLSHTSPTSDNSYPNEFDASRLLTSYGNAPEITGIEQWINTENKPYSIKELKGKVVLVDFWTYSCVNCIRTLPYLRSWHEKYQDKGLTIIGVHSPEFAFERVTANVEKAVQDFDLRYPVALDNEFQTWRAFSNRYWPAKYLVDANGVIRYRHFGEGRYEDTERAIQVLLAEAGEQANLEISKGTSEIRESNITPETYMGYQRLNATQLIIKETLNPDQATAYTPTQTLQTHQYTLEGKWNITKEYAETTPGSQLRLRFRADEVNLVMSTTKDTEHSTGPNNTIAEPAAVQSNNLPKGTNFCTNEVCIGASEQALEGIPVIVRVSNPQLINTNNDLREGVIHVNQSKLYRLVELSKPSENIIELEFPEGGVRLYAWTF